MGGLTILIVPNDGLENISYIQVLARHLQERGHQTIFAIDIASKGVVAYNGFEEDLNQLLKKNLDSNKTKLNENTSIFNSPPIRLFEKFSLKCLRRKFLKNKSRESYYEELIRRISPHIIIVESVICSPALTNSGIPWVWLNFGALNRCLDADELPPADSGLSIYNDKDYWNEFRDRRNELLNEIRNEINKWCIGRGGPPLRDTTLLHPISPFLNVYVYPKELGFSLTKDFLTENWINVDTIMNPIKENFEIPEELNKKSGKLIYLSLKPFDMNVIKRLLSMLSLSENKFIVTKGPLHNEYELPDNMWGLEELPQTEAIRAADLVMTNGDYRTVVESVFYGKPMIVMPLFGHQLDNAQRVKDNGFGIILEPYRCQLSTTLSSITCVVNDYQLDRRLNNISEELQTIRSKSGLKLFSARIENLCNYVHYFKQ